MSYLTSIFLGFVQGAAEFLPISSSGHLAIFQNLFSMENYEQSHMFFNVLLHLGTLVSVCIVYRKDIIDMIKEFFSLIKLLKTSDEHTAAGSVSPARRLLFLLIAATLPMVLVLFFKDSVEALYSNTTFIGIALLITGILLFASDRVRRGRKTERNARIWQAVAVGFSQVVAVLPGISRSGTTISVGKLLGFNHDFAVRFSFLLSVPAILGANIISLLDAFKDGIDTSLLGIYIAGVISAAVFGYLAIKLVKRLTEKGKFSYFAYYCWLVGAITIVVSLLV